MEHARSTHALIVITLLQLCRAEISEIIPGTWFSANAINDGYSPKPILELFSTEPSPGFSPTKPIIVLPSYSPPQPEPEVTNLSTTSPNFPTSTAQPPSSTSSYTTSSTPFPPSSPYPTSSTSFDTSSPLPPSSTAFTQSSSFFPTSSSFSPVSESVTTPFPPPENFPIFNFPSSPPPSPLLSTSLPQTTREGKTQSGLSFEVPLVPTLAPFLAPQTQTTAPPNYFVIYQNGPQSIQSFPQPQQPESSKAPILPSTLTTRPLPPVTARDTVTPFITTSALSDGTSRPTITFRSTPPTFTTSRTPFTTASDFSTSAPSTKLTSQGTPRTPLRIQPGPPKAPFLPNLKIRIVAPKGSITNVKFNPTTTTKRPTTRRNKKQKNTYELCTDHCKGKKDPICAVPLGTLIVDPQNLKGFPSICHMACHNSFKKDLYEKIVDGRCGRLRTRIVRVDTKTKVHREELKKSEYSIINTGPKAVVELAGANIK